MANRISPRSIVAVVDKCLEEELPVFKATIQDIVDELEVPRYFDWFLLFRLHPSAALQRWLTRERHRQGPVQLVVQCQRLPLSPMRITSIGPNFPA